MTNKRQTRTIATAVGVALLGGMAIFAPEARSADHRDSTALEADPTADINDVYTFMDGTNLVMAMTVFPFATAAGVDGGAAPAFSNAVQYVFHTASGKFELATDPVDVICTFKSATSVQCWVGTAEYVTGDPSMASKPLASADGKVKVFAGLRGDPFHFNLQGFKDTEAAVEAAASSLTFNAEGCPNVGATTSAALLGLLSEKTSTALPSKTAADDFAGADTLALVVSVDSSLVTKGGALVSVWGATYTP
jgi:hypothetical protein